MKRIVHTSIPVLLALSVAARAGASDDLTVVSSDARAVVIEFRPSYSAIAPVAGTGGPFAFHDFAGSIPPQDLQNTGEPDLRYRLVPLGFPGDAGHSVRVLSADYEDLRDVRLAPVAAYRLRDEFPEVDGYTALPAAYSRTSFLPGVVAELGPVGRVRSMMIGGIRIFPLQYNPATATLRKYSRILVEVTFGPQQGRPVRNEDDRLFEGDLLNFPQAKGWKFEAAGGAPATTVPALLASGEWYRLSVPNEGVFRLDASYLAGLGIPVGSIDPRTIKIYGNGGALLPESPTATRPDDLTENAILVSGESDGTFDAGDFVLFYGRGTRTWTYSRTQRLHTHSVHYYSDVNYYWLTFGGTQGKRMAQQGSLSDNPTVVPDRFTDFVVVEEEKVNFLSSGKEWFGQSVNPGGSFTHVSVLNGIVAGAPVRYRTRVVARMSVNCRFTLRETGDSLASVILSAVGMGSNDFQYASEGTIDVTRVPALNGSISQAAYSLAPSSANGTGWIDWLEIHYPRRFEAVNGYLRFRSPDTAGVVEYRLAQFPTRPTILNVSDPFNVRQITGDVGSYTIRVPETSGTVSEYCAVGPGGYSVPSGAVRMPNQNLRGYADGAQFIIITHSGFRQAADRLAAHRRQPAYGGFRTLVVEVDTIYNEFGGGLPDITAVRDFLKFAYDTWTPRPEYVLFLGGASYDYKGISGARSSYVPTWQTLQSLYDINSYSTDDYFVKLAPNDLPWMATGRISSRTAGEASTVVDKLMRYDTGSSRDGWSSRMLFLGDDSWTPDREDGIIHSNDAEILATNFTPEEFEKRKIYIAEYPTVNTAQGRRKPGAYQALIDEINRGVLVLNFAGHGNPTVWCHEAVFSVQTSIPQLVNTDRLSVFYAATCNFSQFDDLRRYTGSEILMNKPDGGSIGVVSATRKVFAGANAYFHQGIFRQMFRRDAFGRLIVERPARAMYLQKTIQNSQNDQKFFYMGDPTMRFAFPSGYAAVDSINAEPVDSVGGLPRTSPIQLRALSRVTVRGTIRNAANEIDASVNGTATVTLNDATRFVTIVAFVPGRYDQFGNYIPPIDWTYRATGGTLYRGQNTVTGGRFGATFIVPKDILYADPSSRGRLVVSATGPAGEGLGYTSQISIGGTDTAASVDAQGPDIRIFLDGRSFRGGDPVSEQPLLIVDLADSSGINTSVSGIGHRIEAWINDSPESRDITEFYTSTIDNFQEGTAQVVLRDIGPGKNSIRVRAWDTYNNPATGETFFEVTSTDQLRISDVFNYPNPFAGATSFTFRQNLQVPLDVTVKIYTTAGRLIQSIETPAAGEPFVRIPWDGRDRDGDELANGVYLYKMVVKTADGRFTSEEVGRLAVVK